MNLFYAKLNQHQHYLFKNMSFFDSHLEQQSNFHDSLPSLEGMNESNFILPIVRSQVQLVPQQMRGEGRNRKKVQENGSRRKRKNAEEVSQTSHCRHVSRKMKWNLEQKKKYWSAILDFMIQYPFLKVSWTVEKSRQPSFFKYVEKRVETKDKKQCKCFDQNQMKTYFLYQTSNPLDIPDVAIRFLSQFSNEPIISEKLQIFHKTFAEEEFPKEDRNPLLINAKQKQFQQQKSTEETPLQDCIENYVNGLCEEVDRGKKELREILNLKTKIFGN